MYKLGVHASQTWQQMTGELCTGLHGVLTLPSSRPELRKHLSVGST